MALLVQKFGGSSLRDADHIRSVAELIARTVRRGDQVVATVSAMGDETDQLLELAPTVSSVRPGREMDMLVTSGERKAAALVCLALEELGVPTKGLTGSQAGIATDREHMQARILDIHPERIREALGGGFVPVVGGAQGMSDTADVTFLGRGGTDTTAVALASALSADACELYTDVRGLYSADPRIVPDARLLPHLSFDQMVEMCAAGCPKPATRAVELARARDVVLHVRCATDEGPGTVIDAAEADGLRLAVVSDASPHDPDGAAPRGAATVSLVGPDVDVDPTICSRMHEALLAQSIPAELAPASAMRLSWQVPGDHLRRAVRALHRAAYPEPADAAPARGEAAGRGHCAHANGRTRHHSSVPPIVTAAERAHDD